MGGWYGFSFFASFVVAVMAVAVAVAVTSVSVFVSVTEVSNTEIATAFDPLSRLLDIPSRLPNPPS